MFDASANLKKRLKSERRFQIFCITAISFALIFVLILFLNIFSSGYSAFYKTTIAIDVDYSQVIEDTTQFAAMSDDEINKLDLFRFSKKSIYSLFPDIEDRKEKKLLIHSKKMI